MKILEAQVDRNPVRVVAIPANCAREYWPNVERFAESALQHAADNMTVQTVLEMIVSGNLILVVVTDERDVPLASMTFEVVDKPEGKICHCMTLGGDDLETWVEDFVEVWRAVAKQLDCKRVTIKGRAGWERYAKRFGFEHQYTIMSLEV